MGKNHRHKKVLRSEKSKVKLKAKSAKAALLPKGANETKVDMKIKSIVIPEQLKAHKTEEPLTRRKLNLKDVLMRLNHHNLSVKLEACDGILELLSGISCDALKLHLNGLLHGLCKLVLDLDRKVRQKAVKIISNVLEKISASNLTPFFDMLVSYASCAMTHIDKNVQEDSLLLVDVYLDYAPALITKFCNKILDNFLVLISKMHGNVHLLRTVSLKLNSRITSVKWQIRVLTRLQRILQTVADHTYSTTNEISSFMIVDASNSQSFIPIYKDLQVCPIKLFSLSPTAVHSESKLQEYVAVLMPLLNEVWTEVAPSSKQNDIDDAATIIGQEVATVLSCVVAIFYLLWNLTKNNEKTSQNEIKKIFLMKEGQKFLNSLLEQFPYRQHEREKQKISQFESKFLEVNLDVECITENFLIAYIFCAMPPMFLNDNYIAIAKNILLYLKKCLTVKNYVKDENIQHLLLVLQVIFFENSKLWYQKGISVQHLLDYVVHFQTQLDKDSPKTIEVFNLLCNIVHLPHLRSYKYEQWLCNLPTLLHQSKVSSQVVDILSVLARQNNQFFLEKLSEELPNILASLPMIKIMCSASNDPYPYKLKIVGMFHYLKMHHSDRVACEEFLRVHEGSQIAKYVKELLFEK